MLINRPKNRQDLAKIRLAGEHLSGLWPTLVQTLSLARDFSENILGVDKLTATIYGEFIQEGTASSKEDKFGYADRGFVRGHLYAFGVGLKIANLQEDSGQRNLQMLRDRGYSASLRVRKNDDRFLVLQMNNVLQEKLRSRGFATIDTREMLMKDIFPTYADFLKRADTVEGVIICIPAAGTTIKWKGAEETYNDTRMEKLLGSLSSDLEKYPKVREAIVSVVDATFASTTTKSNCRARLLAAFDSAASKFPTLEDELTSLNGKCEGVKDFKASARVLVRDYTDRIAREMLEDAAGDQQFIKGITEAIEKKAMTKQVKKMIN